MKEKYNAQGICTNCGHRDFPQWGEYAVGTRLESYSCSNCGCMTWGLDSITTPAGTQSNLTQEK